MEIAIVTFDDFTDLDLFILWDLLNRVAGFGMGPIFPTSVGLASALVPRIEGTAISLVMAVGFAGLLLISPAVGYISTAAGGAVGDVRTGLLAVVAASALMFLLHLALTLRERSRARQGRRSPDAQG